MDHRPFIFSRSQEASQLALPVEPQFRVSERPTLGRNSIRLGIFIDGTFIPERDGASTRFANFPKYLSLGGVEVVVFHCYRGWSDLTRIAEASFRTYFFPQKIFYHNIDYVADVVRQSGVTLIQMNDVESISQVGYRISTALKLRLIFEAHYHTSSLAAALGVSPERVRLLQRLENNVCRNADHLVVFTEEDRNRWLSLSQCPANRISVVPFGIEAPSQTSHEGRQGIAFLGNMYYEPNRRAVLRIVHEVLPNIRSQLPNTPAYVVGDIPDDLRLLCLSSNIDVIGEVEAPGFILTKAAVGIAPITEGSGVRVKILSYIAAGLPVVATSIGSEGLSFPSVFEENTLMSTAARCIDILKRPEFYRLLVLKTNTLVNQKHLWRHVVSGAVDIYDHIAKRNRREPEVAPIFCGEDPMWIQEVLKKGRFSVTLAPDMAPSDSELQGAANFKYMHECIATI